MPGREEGETSMGITEEPQVPSISIGITNLKEKLEKIREAKEIVMNQSQTPKIQKVGFYLRQQDDFHKNYEPKLVSLGPIHHGNPNYQLGENYKLLLTYEFIGGSGKNMEDVYNMIKEKIYELRTCYEEEVTKAYDDEALTSILFVDGCAILQYIYRAPANKFEELNIKTDVAFEQQDLFLLENQLPYCLLTSLMSLSVKKEELSKSIETYIDSYVYVPKDLQLNWLSWRLFTDSHDKEEPQEHTISVALEPVHLLDHLRTRILHGQEYIHGGKVGKIQTKIQNFQEWQSYPSVQELQTAGIHFKCGENCHFLSNISFTRKFLFRGQLHIPPIVLDVSTRSKFLNLIAYEMCLDFKNDFGVISYIFFLNSLINEANDVKILKEARILRSVLGRDEEVAEIFKEIGTNLVPNIEIYKDVRSQIQKHYRSKWMTWIAQFLDGYFSSPWAFIAFLGALLALALTITQTWYAVNSHPGPCDNFCKNLTPK